MKATKEKEKPLKKFRWSPTKYNGDPAWSAKDGWLVILDRGEPDPAFHWYAVNADALKRAIAERFMVYCMGYIWEGKHGSGFPSLEIAQRKAEAAWQRGKL